MDPRVRLALEILADSRFAREGLSRAAKTTNLSASRLRHLIKTEVSIPPAKYIRHLRMQRAAELLGNTFLSVKEVAVQVGAGDMSHFVQDFKKAFGVTPKTFQRALQRSKAS